jgi:hypothetical protein
VPPFCALFCASGMRRTYCNHLRPFMLMGKNILQNQNKITRMTQIAQPYVEHLRQLERSNSERVVNSRGRSSGSKVSRAMEHGNGPCPRRSRNESPLCRGMEDWVESHHLSSRADESCSWPTRLKEGAGSSSGTRSGIGMGQQQASLDALK